MARLATVLSTRFATLAAGLLLAATAAAQAPPGQAAPDFRLPDVKGKAIALKDFRGRFVVLEWNNPHCPFVKKHYGSGNMQSLQARYGGEGVAWLAINSTAVGHEEYTSPSELATWLTTQKAHPTALLIDSDGAVGHAYSARTTPQMVVIDPQGVVIYNGAIDDRRSTNPADVKGAKNYVAAALDEARAGRAVSTPTTTPYGCSVKYR